MEKYIHAKVHWGETYIYREEGVPELKQFEYDSDAIVYLQKQGFKLVTVVGEVLWFAKKIKDDAK
ncbi:hypothetical protein [Caldibacillus debilis]|uniref:Uncharacterized protein n=1 Tax=Caldibacillus debilis GB1 TaxID=1339248 RepID=A0A420VEM8_9BACI|nr:hypothetical protein [Caldibacillus debilis]RKO61868.1 hypothetical protein Cdeb_01363 [Caldibacillus debilis GB1]